MYDLAQFSLKEMTECGAALRKLGTGAASLEEVANRVVRYLHEQLGDLSAGRPACALVRFFKTHPFKELGPELRRYARGKLKNQPIRPQTRCFTLMATAGKRSEWNVAGQSKSFRTIPLGGANFTAQFPMFSQLLAQFGISLPGSPRPGDDLLVSHEEHSFNVFYVPEAKNSPYVPRQEEFVIPYGIRSVLGFGGMLPSGDIFAVILFAQVPVRRDIAELFKTLALAVKIAVLPFDGEPAFSRRPPAKKRRTS
jgi:hypothetical protein